MTLNSMQRSLPIIRSAHPARVEFAAEGSDAADDRTAMLRWSAGTPILRSDWDGERFWLQLKMDQSAARLDRLNSGAPLLNAHNDWSLASVIGVVESAVIADGEARARVRFSKRDDVEPIYRDVKDGIIRNVSVGYQIHALEELPDKLDGLTHYLVTDFEPHEISLVPIGADPFASVMQSGDQIKYPCSIAAHAAQELNVEIETTVAEVAVVEDRGAVAAAAVAAERERALMIRQIATGVRVPEMADALIADGATIEEARAKILDTLAKRSAEHPIRSSADIINTRDETDTIRQGMSDAILNRANPSLTKQSDMAAPYRGMSLIDMARSCLERQGLRTTGLSRREVAVAALNLDRDLYVRQAGHSTSDFPNILANTINRTLRMAYELAPRTFTVWARQSTIPDFKEASRTQLSDMTAMQTIAQGGEYKYLSFGDAAEKYSLVKYGGIIAVTWETLVNDDLMAFDRIPAGLAAEAAQIEGDVVYGILSTNANMADGVALFHATHGNLAGTPAAITDVTLGLGRAAMRKQTGPKGRFLNVTPSTLVVGPDKESEANKFTSSQFVAAKSVDINPAFNTSLAVVVDARITGNTWYLMAMPGLIDTVEYAFLEGENGLFTEQRTGFEVDGLEVKARHVFAAKAIDWRGMWKNAGA